MDLMDIVISFATTMLRVCMYYCRCRLHWVDGWMGIIINPRRACAARVTVVVLCVCPSVRLSVCLFVCPRLFSDYRLRGGL